MTKTFEDVAKAENTLATKQAKIFIKNNPKASKQEVFERAFLSGMAVGVEMLTNREKQK